MHASFALYECTTINTQQIALLRPRKADYQSVSTLSYIYWTMILISADLSHSVPYLIFIEQRAKVSFVSI
jgi:hypothetical protein